MSNENIYFAKDLSERERACFEAGIKLGALYHILCGIPISTNDSVINAVEKGIEAAISCQPYVKKVKVSLKKEEIRGNKSNEFDYDEITGKIIRANLIIEYKATKIIAKIDWKEDLEYPLMYIEKIESLK
ncbi:MAG: dihydroneopterin aldolase family protein [Promethearchaeia archaeon]